MELDKKEIREFFWAEMVAEKRRLVDFIGKLDMRSFADGHVVVMFSDGHTEQYPIHPIEREDVIKFVQSLSNKRVQMYKQKIEEYKED
jgi:diadenosine tetraphosphate (Ap4A) HIT family hydrolase